MLESLDYLESYRTKFYRVVAPAGTIGPMAAAAVNLQETWFNENGDARIRMWKPNAAGAYSPLQVDTGLPLPSFDAVLNPPDDTFTQLKLKQVAQPFDEYFLALNRRDLASLTGVGITFAVPVSGTPDLVVDEIELSPNNGETRVEVTVHNQGYAPVLFTESLYSYTDTTNPANPTTTQSLMEELPVAPLGTRSRILSWLPVRLTDTVSFEADHGDKVEELHEGNNTDQEILSSVDAHRPRAVIELENASQYDRSGNGGANDHVFGRYISGVYLENDIIVRGFDDDGDLHTGEGRHPFTATPMKTQNGSIFFWGGDDYHLRDMNFGGLLPTAADNPNKVWVVARDAYGLLSEPVEKTIQVVDKPSWLSNESSEISFNEGTYQYDYEFPRMCCARSRRSPTSSASRSRSSGTRRISSSSRRSPTAASRSARRRASPSRSRPTPRSRCSARTSSTRPGAGRARSLTTSASPRPSALTR